MWWTALAALVVLSTLGVRTGYARQGSATTAPGASTAGDSAYAIVRLLFDAMRARDTAAMRATFVPNASMQTILAHGIRFEAVDGWLSSVARARPGVVLDERLANAVVKVDGPLASVWVDYWFFADARFSHCGVDAVLLARQDGVWRIFSVVDTRRTTDCPPAPASSLDVDRP